MTTLSKRVSFAAAWSVLNLVVNRGGTAIVMLVLAGYVGPEAFGLFAVVAVFREVALVIATAGLGQAVIREQNVTAEDLDSVFWFNIAVSTALYGLVWVAAPFVADIYGNPQLSALLRVTCVVFVFGGLRVIPVAVLSRNLDFRSQAFAQTISTVVSGALAFGAVYAGWGIWSLVVLLVAMTATTATMTWYFSGWYPRLRFSWRAFRPYWHFGKNLLFAGMAWRLATNSYVLVLGGVFTTQIAGWYFFAQKVQQLTGQMLSGAVNQAAYPALAKFQHDDNALRQRYRRVLSLLVFVVAPVTLITGGLASIWLPLIMGPEWAGAVIYVQLLMIAAAVFPINLINVNAITVKGRTDFILWLDIGKICAQFAILLGTIPLGPLAVVSGQAVFALLCWPVHGWVNHRLFGYGLIRQVKDVWKPLIAASFVAVSVLAVNSYCRLAYTLLNLFWLTAGSGLMYLLLCQFLRETSVQWLASRAAQHCRLT